MPKQRTTGTLAAFNDMKNLRPLEIEIFKPNIFSGTKSEVIEAYEDREQFKVNKAMVISKEAKYYLDEIRL